MSTTIGQILDEFFSPFSKEKIWIMPEKDNYTKIVRKWQPVINTVNRAKMDVSAHCAFWKANRMTTSSWKPRMTDPPVTDPKAHRTWVSSPPGTNPATCKKAFIIYASSYAASKTVSPLIPTVQTWELYTCSIGSFGIYITVDSIDCAAKTAKMNVWMYNAMDQQSFGPYATHKAFSLSKMKRQYMWWNWSESHKWGSASTTSNNPGPKRGTTDW